MTQLEHALDTTEAYVAHFESQSLPVLKRTVRELDTLREDEESVSGRRIAAVILGDPLMAMRVISFLERKRGATQNHDITTVDRAVMMMGITPFFREFYNLPIVEDLLAKRPKALIGLLQVIGRARRAAHFARDWAILRHDLDVDEITLAALLREATEILCWCFAPVLTEKVYAMQKADPTLRSVVAQREVFGFTAQEIQSALVKAWRLPALLVSLMNEADAENPRVQTVALAAALARHSAHGWTDPALPDDFEAIGTLVHMGREPLLKRLGLTPEEAAPYLPLP
ncbi:MAG: HDOD domain-containing protein [Rhodocyclaceae bacterium]|nr:HDOD domain-containing protein [Rhodocyclaceae bacterium]MCB1900419.1 HDOD domain-containing protein [Rhodocyclaceae bacterium]MCP5309817.1 HDOD domain-containing protein [Zoogloeaceae bacterium]